MENHVDYINFTTTCNNPCPLLTGLRRSATWKESELGSTQGSMGAKSAVLYRTLSETAKPIRPRRKTVANRGWWFWRPGLATWLPLPALPAQRKHSVSTLYRVAVACDLLFLHPSSHPPIHPSTHPHPPLLQPSSIFLVTSPVPLPRYFPHLPHLSQKQ